MVLLRGVCRRFFLFFLFGFVSCQNTQHKIKQCLQCKTSKWGPRLNINEHPCKKTIEWWRSYKVCRICCYQFCHLFFVKCFFFLWKQKQTTQSQTLIQKPYKNTKKNKYRVAPIFYCNAIEAVCYGYENLTPGMKKELHLWLGKPVPPQLQAVAAVSKNRI